MFDRKHTESGHASRWQTVARLFYSRATRAALIGVAIGISGVTPEPVRAEPPATLTYRTSWLGNTYGIPGQHVMQDVMDLAITPDGKVVGATTWDEGGNAVQVFQNGAHLARVHESGHGWGRTSNGVVATDATYIYQSIRVDGPYGNIPEGQTLQGIKRYKHDGSPAGFADGTQYDNSWLNVVTSDDARDKPVYGLVAVNNELFAADSYSNTMKVYQLPLAGQEVKRSFPITRPGRLDADADGFIWMLQTAQGNSPATLVRYSPTGELQPQQIVLPDTVRPVDFCIDRPNGRILVTNDGVDQNILIYNTITTKPTLSGTFGTTGGIYSGKVGEVGPLKFNRPYGVGIDNAGNIYVGNNGIGLEAYSPDGKRLWELLNVFFVDCTDVLRSDETIVYGKEERFVMDYSKPVAGTEWTYKGYTLNRFKYPQDARQHTGRGSVLVREIEGKTFLYMTAMYGEPYAVYRFNAATDGETAIPCALFGASESTGSWPPNRPAKGEWVWTDANGDGAFDADEYRQPADPKNTGSWTWNVDSQGTVWTLNSATGKIRSFPCQGINASGAPIYNFDKIYETDKPESLTALNTIQYDPKTDVMFLTGYTKEFPAPEGYGAGVVGHALMRVNDWSSGNRTPMWTAEIQMDIPKDRFDKAITMAGDYLFSVECRGVYTVTVFSKATGEKVGELLPGPEIGSKQGWIDIPYGIAAYQRANGEYLVFVEDDGFCKVVMYRMTDGRPVKAAAPSFNLFSGTYERVQTVTIEAPAGATIRYTTDGSTPTASNGEVYRSPVTIGNQVTLRAIASKDGLADSDVSSSFYSINNKVAALNFSPPANTYSTAELSITLSSPTRGASIRYTTDGTAPTATTGTEYVGPVKISKGTTVKAIALADGMAPSDVADGNYVISSEEVRLTPASGDSFLFNGDAAEEQSRNPLPSTYDLIFDNAVRVNRLVMAMPSAWGGPVEMRAEIRGGMTRDAMTSLVAPTVYSISGNAPPQIIIPATNLKYLQIVISASHDGRGNLSEVEVYGQNVQIQSDASGH